MARSKSTRPSAPDVSATLPSDEEGAAPESAPQAEVAAPPPPRRRGALEQPVRPWPGGAATARVRVTHGTLVCSGHNHDDPAKPGDVVSLPSKEAEQLAKLGVVERVE